jgi:hypothetical protein
MFLYLVSVFIIFLIFTDRLFLPKTTLNAWRALTLVNVLGLFSLWVPKPLISTASALGLSRPIDLIIYPSVIILIRELFLSRARLIQLQNDLTRLARAYAVDHAEREE